MPEVNFKAVFPSLLPKGTLASGATALLRNTSKKSLFLTCFISLSARRRRAKLLGSVIVNSRDQLHLKAKDSLPLGFLGRWRTEVMPLATAISQRLEVSQP
jgi:hypothetical protein